MDDAILSSGENTDEATPTGGSENTEDNSSQPSAIPDDVQKQLDEFGQLKESLKAPEAAADYKFEIPEDHPDYDVMGTDAIARVAEALHTQGLSQDAANKGLNAYLNLRKTAVEAEVAAHTKALNDVLGAGEQREANISAANDALNNAFSTEVADAIKADSTLNNNPVLIKALIELNQRFKSESRMTVPSAAPPKQLTKQEKLSQALKDRPEALHSAAALHEVLKQTRE